LTFTFGKIAATVDEVGKTTIQDFWGSSNSEVADGIVTIEVLDNPPHGKQSQVYVLRVLASVLSHGDQSKPQITDGIDSNGEDGILTFAKGEKVPVQVVTVPIDQDHWKKVSAGHATVTLSVNQAATWIHEAITKKAAVIEPHFRAKIVLALDIRHAAQFAHDDVASAFYDQGGQSFDYGFLQVWFVASTTGRCRRLF
jgi:hypothetical protein